MSDGILDRTVHRLQIKLSILGSDKDFAEINKMLGVEAKHYARSGQSVEGRPIAKQNVWSYWGDAPGENADFVSQWTPIAHLIGRKRSEIAALGQQAKLQVAVVVFAFSGFPGINLSRETINEINSIAAALDVDLYGSLTGEVY